MITLDLTEKDVFIILKLLREDKQLTVIEEINKQMWEYIEQNR